MSELPPKLYLLDVEGTIAPISLVTDQLFPYARAHFEPFLRHHIAALEHKGDALEPSDIGEGSVLWDLATLRLENRAERDPLSPQIMPDSVEEFGLDPQTATTAPGYAIPRILKYIYWLMDRDRKSTALKSLQGKIWKSGFENGELKGTLFDDVPDAIMRWRESASVGIYSSGSVEAQKLLLRHSTFGDLTPWVQAHFDTRIGAKTAAASYKAIASAMAVVPGDVLFLSDAVGELDAAREAGCGTRLVVRPGNAPLVDLHGHSAVESFAGL